MKVLTLVSGKISLDKSAEFEAEYRILKGKPLPPGLEASYLLKSTNDPGLYSIQSIWSSREMLDEMRKREKPKAVAAFESLGVTPQVEIKEVVESIL